MHIREHVILKDFTTMRLGGEATALAEVHNKADLLQALRWAEERQLPTLVLGGGSNVIFRNGFKGLVLVNRMAGFAVLSEDKTSLTVQVGAGENWDQVVARTVDMNLSGIEALSAIPGTTGATPVQNVGAYGQEIADTLLEVEALNLHTQQFVVLTKDDCKFSYRSSIFKAVEDRQYVITSVTLRLRKQYITPPLYASLQKYLDEHGITDYSPQNIRQAVVAVRRQKLPDPKVVANTGSFFKNPIISAQVFAPILAAHPQIPHWPTGDDRVKLAAGWLIEQTGLKGYQSHGMRTYEHNALVFVNEAAQSYDDLAAFREEVVQKVFDKFGVRLQQEPELI